MSTHGAKRPTGRWNKFPLLRKEQRSTFQVYGADYGQSATPAENQLLVSRLSYDPHCRYDEGGASLCSQGRSSGECRIDRLPGRLRTFDAARAINYREGNNWDYES